MITIKRRITVSVEKRKRKGILIEENAPIFLRLSYMGNRINLYSGFRVDLDNWDNKNRIVKSGIVNRQEQSAEEINVQISRFKSEIDSFFLKCQIDETIPTTDAVKSFFEKVRHKDSLKNQKIDKKESDHASFFDMYDEFTAYTGRVNNWTKDTFKKHKTIKNHLLAHNDKLTFDDINNDGLLDILNYFTNKAKLRNSTVRRHFKMLRTFLSYSHKTGALKSDDYLEFKPKLKEVDKKIVFLTEEEINKIKKTDIPEDKKYLEPVRDVLLFLCYTGLRHSDAHKLRKHDVKENVLEVTTKKTSDNLTVDLNNESRSILEKYKDVTLKDDKALPVLSNQRMNLYLKELGELAEIDEPVTETYFRGNKRHDYTMPKYERMSTHIGRRTFICLCIIKGIPIPVIMKWTGHTDYKSMQPYIDVTGKSKEIEMQKLNF